MAKQSSVDVVVVGFGAGGIAAAITAHDEGAEVVVLEKMPKEKAGGNTRAAGQVWYTPSTPELAKAYLRDLEQEMPTDDEVADTWAQEQCRNSEWLTARAAEAVGHFDPLPGDPHGDSPAWVAHTFAEAVKIQTGWDTERDEFPEFNNDGGTDYITFGGTQGRSRLWLRIKGALHSRGINVRYATRAVGLTSDDSGRVTGVRVSTPDGDEVIEARKGVILACGGFENNPEMIRAYLGVPYATPWGSPANTGDGIRMGQALGADLQNMYQHMPFFGIRIPGSEVGEFVHPSGPGFILVRKDGKRYIDDTTGYSHGKTKQGGKYEFWPGKQATWVILDEATRNAGPLTMLPDVYPAGWMKIVEGYRWSDDSSVEIEKGWIQKADTIGELAEKLGLPPEALEAEVARYNGYCEAGEDPFGRAPASLVPLGEGPYYGYQWGNLIINTMGGLRKDGQARVLHVDGHPIPGLYAAGEIASTYTWALSGGQSIGDALGFGRVAGRNAAAG